MAKTPSTPDRLTAQTEGARVTSFELFFDLVFVYAFTQVTQLMVHDPTPQGMLRGLLVLGLLWWCWSGLAWLGNTVRLDEGLARGVLLLVTATMFVIGMTIPEVFHDQPGGLASPVVFVCCYFVVRLAHQLLYMHATRHDPNMRRQLALNWVPWVGSIVLLAFAAFQHGWAQTGLWAAALVWDYVIVLLMGVSGWRITSAAHWAERHGLIVIIALGESIIGIGIGAAGLPISGPIVVAAVLGVSVAGALWWVYFDVVALAAERALAQARGVHRARLGTHAYTYLHLPLIAGIVLLALGIEKVLRHADDAHWSDPLQGVGLYALYGGVTITLLGYVGFCVRIFGTWEVHRIVAAAVALATLPLASFVPALATLGVVAVVLWGMAGYESVQYAETRAALRRP